MAGTIRRAHLQGVALAFTAVTTLAVTSVSALSGAGANALLHPQRQSGHPRTPAACTDTLFDGDGVTLHGWRCPTDRPRRGTVIYLHGAGDTRAGGAGIARHFMARGFDVVAYDSRAHGESEGTSCTYGFYEKWDLKRVVDALAPGPLVLLGNSLGAAVALQEAATDPRVTAVVAAEIFSDLRTVATERAPFFFSHAAIRLAFSIAERDGHFTADDVSPVRAASQITAPVLLVHGEADIDTKPAHSQRVYAALAGRKRLVLVSGTGHSRSLSEAWDDVDRWIDETVR